MDQLHSEHSVGGQLGEHFGHAGERVSPVVLRELHLVGQLDAVVDLFAYALRDLVGQRAHVEVAILGHEALDDLDEREEQLGVGQVVADGVGDAGILHLDRDLGAVVL